MREHLVTPLHRAALTTFRHLPAPARWAVVRRTTPTFSVGCLLVAVRDDDTVLVLRQRHQEGWTLPGGLLARRETPRQGLLRELAEELGLRTPALRALGLPDEPTAVAFHPHERHIDAIFRVDPPAGAALDLTPDGTEVLQAGWLRPDDPRLSTLTLDALERVRDVLPAPAPAVPAG